ncbi:MAG: hypothetical protein R2822_22330 [Spirosomataceae bacterium]
MEQKRLSQSRKTKTLEQIGIKLRLKNIALTFVPSLTDTESEVNLYKINPSVENTFVIYRHRTIVDKWINLKPTSENFKKMIAALERTKGSYFELPEPKYK